MQAFKTEPVHSKGVQEQQGNVTSQNFQHQNTLNPEHAPQQDSGKVSWEVTPASSSCCQGLTNRTLHCTEAPPPMGCTTARAHTPQGQGEETLVSFVLFMTQKRSWLARRT